MIAPALALITTADPLVAMAAGAACLHEKIAAAPVDLAAEGLFLAVTTGGIIALAQSAPQVAQATDSPGTAAPGRAVGSTAGDRPRAATRHLTRARLAPLTVTPSPFTSSGSIAASRVPRASRGAVTRRAARTARHSGYILARNLIPSCSGNAGLAMPTMEVATRGSSRL